MQTTKVLKVTEEQAIAGLDMWNKHIDMKDDPRTGAEYFTRELESYCEKLDGDSECIYIEGPFDDVIRMHVESI